MAQWQNTCSYWAKSAASFTQEGGSKEQIHLEESRQNPPKPFTSPCVGPDMVLIVYTELGWAAVGDRVTGSGESPQTTFPPFPWPGTASGSTRSNPRTAGRISVTGTILFKLQDHKHSHSPVSLCKPLRHHCCIFSSGSRALTCHTSPHSLSPPAHGPGFYLSSSQQCHTMASLELPKVLPSHGRHRLHHCGTKCLRNTRTGGDFNGVKTVACGEATEKESSGSRVQILLVFSSLFKQA